MAPPPPADHSLSLLVLAENTVRGAGLRAEHGFSCLLRSGERSILFDAGQGLVLEANAHRLGVDLRTIDSVALSHGHYDHAGGLQALLEVGARPTLYAHSEAFRTRYAQAPSGRVRTVGPPPRLWADIERAGWPTRAIDGPVEVAGGIRLTGPIDRVTPRERTSGPFYLDALASEPDPIVDDQALWFDTPDGIVIVLGCAHAGVVNTVLQVRRAAPDRPIHLVAGGMHLVSATPRRIDDTIRDLRDLGVERVSPAHCTGFEAASRLRAAFQDRCQPWITGTSLELELAPPDRAGGQEPASDRMQ